jgi:hypothetical protein
MNQDDKEGFEHWLYSNFKIVDLPNPEEKEKWMAVWNAAIKYEQNKPIRTYRWDGVIP